MTWISSADLDYMRSMINGGMLPDTCNILAAALVADGEGGATTTWGTAYAGVACRLDAKSGDKTTQNERLTPYHTYQLTLPYNASISTANRVQAGGYLFDVVTIDPPGKSWSACVRCELEIVNG